MNTLATGEQEILHAGKTYTVGYLVRGDIIYTPAVLGKLPENCSPDESSCDITELLALWAVDSDGNLIEAQVALDVLSPLLDVAEAKAGLWAAYNDEDLDDDDYDDDYDHSKAK